MRTTKWLAVVVLAGSLADAAPKPGFWKVLVTPKAKWVLADTQTNPGETVTVETYDVRKVGKATVARLRWTYKTTDGTTRDITGKRGALEQVAVTDAGLYLLTKDQDDKAIAKVLDKKPDRSDPPKAYEGTKQNHGRFLTINDDTVCMGEVIDAPDECGDDCGGQMCIDAKGIVGLSGQWAPGLATFDRR
jgi:hypothetical protein